MKSQILVATLFGLLLLLTGCQMASTQSQTTTPTPSSATSAPTVSETEQASPKKTYMAATAKGPAKNVTKPAIPKKALDNSDDGAAAFTEYYYDLVNYTIDTNDSAEIKKYTTRECKVCGLSIIDPADKAKEASRWQVGGKHHPRILSSNMSGKNLAVVNVEYSADSIKTYEAPNKLYSQSAGLEPIRVAVAVEFDDGWKVYKIAGIQ